MDSTHEIKHRVLSSKDFLSKKKKKILFKILQVYVFFLFLGKLGGNKYGVRYSNLKSGHTVVT